MKKIILAVIAVMAFSFANAQDGHFKLGLHAGVPVGSSGDVTSANTGVDVAYLWNLGEKFSAGMATGFTNYWGKTYEFQIEGIEGNYTVEGPDLGFIPVAASAQYSLAKNFFAGADVGYAIYVGTSGMGAGTGGFYYQPKVGYQNTKWEFYGAYKGISDVNSVNLGVNYKF